MNDILPNRIQNYLNGIKRSYMLQDIKEAVESLMDLRVLVIGDLIIDEYCYCRVSGIVSKWPVLAAIYQDMRQMVGGGGAIARHVKGFAKEVRYVCTVGDQDGKHRYASRIFQSEGVDYRFFDWRNTFTIAKCRYITSGYPNPLAPELQINDERPSTRLFEIGFMPQSPLPVALENELCQYLEQIVPDYDLVIVADFGHGLVSSQVAKTVTARARWWSVNAQTNSSNYGFNRITKYIAPDFVCIDELEARLPSGDKMQALEEIVVDLKEQMKFGSIMVTRGNEGLFLFDNQTIHGAPALATRVVDALGTGDAVLALASLCRAKHLEDALTVFLSVCGGAVASCIVGNEEPLSKLRLMNYIEGALG